MSDYDFWRLQYPPWYEDDDEQRLSDEDLAAEIADRMEDDWR